MKKTILLRAVAVFSLCSFKTTGVIATNPSKTKSDSTTTVSVSYPCACPCHLFDIIPCQHGYYDIYGNWIIPHVLGDRVPCVHVCTCNCIN